MIADSFRRFVATIRRGPESQVDNMLAAIDCSALKDGFRGVMGLFFVDIKSIKLTNQQAIEGFVWRPFTSLDRFDTSLQTFSKCLTFCPVRSNYMDGINTKYRTICMYNLLEVRLGFDEELKNYMYKRKNASKSFDLCGIGKSE